MLYFPAGNYSDCNLDVAREMILSDRTLYGLSDGGAHVGVICDGSFPTYNLLHWVRDRTRGEKLPIEFVVKNQCRDTARHVGLERPGRARRRLQGRRQRHRPRRHAPASAARSSSTSPPAVVAWCRRSTAT